MADNYNYDMQRLQQDAIRRAREMQSRAQMAAAPQNRNPPNPPRPPAAPQNRNPPNPPRPPAAPNTVQQVRHAPPQEQHSASPRSPAPPKLNVERRPEHEHEREQPKNQMNPVKDIFDSLLSDSERTLILVLILLLVEEKADTGLIFALMYLVL